MFQLTSSNIIQFITLVIYLALFIVILFYGQSRLKKLLLIFLIASLGWSLTSMLVNLQIPYEQLLVCKAMAPIFSTWSIVAYACLASTFIQRGMKLVKRAGYSWLAVVCIVICFGYCINRFEVLDNPTIYKHYESLIDFLPMGAYLMISSIAYLMVRSYKGATDPEERNRTAYWLVGLGLIISVNVAWIAISDKNYNLYHLGGDK